MKRIILFLFISLVIVTCSKDVSEDFDNVGKTFLEKYEGTTWKYWNFEANPEKFYFRFINDLNKPVEYWWRSDRANESNNYCFEHKFVNLTEEMGESITINTHYMDEDVLGNDQSNGTLEYKSSQTVDGIEHLQITTFDITDNVMFYKFEQYKNGDLTYKSIVVFSGHVSSSHVDGLILCGP
jgi:hypothetical protein